MPISLMTKNPDDKHSLTDIVNEIEDDGRIEQLFQDQSFPIVNPGSCIHPKIASESFPFSINIDMKSVSTISSKTKLNVILYVSHIINSFP